MPKYEIVQHLMILCSIYTYIYYFFIVQGSLSSDIVICFIFMSFESTLLNYAHICICVCV